MTDDATTEWRRVDDLSDEERDELLEAAYRAGLDEDNYDGWTKSIDWDGLVKDLELSVSRLSLPEDWGHPFIKEIKKHYRKGRKDRLT